MFPAFACSYCGSLASSSPISTAVTESWQRSATNSCLQAFIICQNSHSEAGDIENHMYTLGSCAFISCCACSCSVLPLAWTNICIHNSCIPQYRDSHVQLHTSVWAVQARAAWLWVISCTRMCMLKIKACLEKLLAQSFLMSPCSFHRLLVHQAGSMPLTFITQARQRGVRCCPSSHVQMESTKYWTFKWIVLSFENEPFVKKSDGADILKGIWNENEG